MPDIVVRVRSDGGDREIPCQSLEDATRAFVESNAEAHPRVVRQDRVLLEHGVEKPGSVLCWDQDVAQIYIAITGQGAPVPMLESCDWNRY